MYWIEILKDYFGNKSLEDFKRCCRNVLTFKISRDFNSDFLRFESTLWEFVRFEITQSNFSKNTKLQEWMIKDNKKNQKFDW